MGIALFGWLAWLHPDWSDAFEQFMFGKARFAADFRSIIRIKYTFELLVDLFHLVSETLAVSDGNLVKRRCSCNLRGRAIKHWFFTWVNITSVRCIFAWLLDVRPVLVLVFCGVRYVGSLLSQICMRGDSILVSG